MIEKYYIEKKNYAEIRVGSMVEYMKYEVELESQAEASTTVVTNGSRTGRSRISA